MKTLQTALVLLGAATILALPIHASVRAEELTPEQIIAKLKPKKLTRSISANGTTPGAINKEQKGELDGLLGRSIGVVEREKIAAITEEAKLPKLEFSIKFGYNSSEIQPESLASVQALGTALASAEIGESKFLVNGHTDAKGDDAYNQSLSQRRANAVVTYLSENYNISPARLKAIGYGESQLKNVDDPESGDNRRVEVVNLTY